MSAPHRQEELLAGGLAIVHAKPVLGVHQIPHAINSDAAAVTAWPARRAPGDFLEEVQIAGQRATAAGIDAGGPGRPVGHIVHTRLAQLQARANKGDFRREAERCFGSLVIINCPLFPFSTSAGLPLVRGIGKVHFVL